jgi:hypothetical protein
MSIQLSIYDFFAYTIPGGFYLLTAVYVAGVFGFSKFDFQQLSDLSIIQVLLVTIPAYILGHITDRIATFWYRLFEPKKLAQTVLDGLIKNYPHLDFKFQARDWPVILAFVQKDTPEAIPEIAKFNVVYLMLRNISLNLVIIAVIEIIVYSYQNASNIWHLIFGITALIFSVITVRQAIRYNKWFYASNFEAMVARSLDPADLIVKKEMTSKVMDEKGRKRK